MTKAKAKHEAQIMANLHGESATIVQSKNGQWGVFRKRYTEGTAIGRLLFSKSKREFIDPSLIKVIHKV
jgi:hypothetical protein